MIDVFGPYLLVIMVWGNGVAVHEVASREACEAARTQLEPVSKLATFCIAAQTVDNRREDQ